jgi:hypothetical protein
MTRKGSILGSGEGPHAVPVGRFPQLGLVVDERAHQRLGGGLVVVQRAWCLGVGEGARAHGLGVVDGVEEEMVLVNVAGAAEGSRGWDGRRVRIEGHERCVCDGGSEEDGHDSEECHQELGEQAAAAGHGGRWPTLTSEERLGTVGRK